jgi:hypothetical protein
MKPVAFLRAIPAAVISVLLSLSMVSPALALVQEDGTQTCSLNVGWLRAYYYHWLAYQAPGGSLSYDTPYDSSWHDVRRSGAGGGGYWYAAGENLNLSLTYAYCAGGAAPQP